MDSLNIKNIGICGPRKPGSPRKHRRKSSKKLKYWMRLELKERLNYLFSVVMLENDSDTIDAMADEILDITYILSQIPSNM